MCIKSADYLRGSTSSIYFIISSRLNHGYDIPRLRLTLSRTIFYIARNVYHKLPRHIVEVEGGSVAVNRQTHGCVKIPQRYVACAVSASAVMVCSISREVYLQSLSDMLFYSLFEDQYLASKCPVMMTTLDESSDAIKADVYWTVDMMSAVTQIFYLGILITSIPAGIIADHFGVRRLMGLGILINAIISLLFPMLTYQSAISSVLGRFIQGLAQGIVYTASETILAQWTLPTEISTMASVVTAAEIGGRILGCSVRSVCNLLSDQWHGQYYVASTIGALWMVVWYWFCYNDPNECPHLSTAEREKIQKSRGEISQQKEWYYAEVPWKSILGSPPFMTLLLAYWPSFLVHFTLAQYHHNTYLVHVIKITPELTQIIMMVARFCMMVSVLYWGVVSDWLVNNSYISRTNNRIILVVFSNVWTAVCMVVMPLFGCDGLALSAVIVILFYARGLGCAVYRAVIVDLSPRHAGLLMAIVNISATTSAFVAWEMVLYVLEVLGDINQWQQLFIICAVLLIIMAMPYVFYGSSEEQKWNYIGETENPDDSTELNDLQNSTQTTQPNDE